MSGCAVSPENTTHRLACFITRLRSTNWRTPLKSTAETYLGVTTHTQRSLMKSGHIQRRCPGISYTDRRRSHLGRALLAASMSLKVLRICPAEAKKMNPSSTTMPRRSPTRVMSASSQNVRTTLEW